MDQKQHCERASRSARVVTFRESVHVKLFRYERTPSCSRSSSRVADFWYTAQELKAMVRQHIAMCRGFEKTAGRDIESFLGLETKAVRMKRRQRIEEAKNAVLMEQSAQWEAKNPKDDYSIPRIYESRSRESRMQALERGRELALSVFIQDAAIQLCGDDTFTTDLDVICATSPRRDDTMMWYPEVGKPPLISQHGSTSLVMIPFFVRPAHRP